MFACCTEGGASSGVVPVNYAYFPVKARGMSHVLALEMSGVNYIPKVVQMDQWAGMKSSGECPFGYLGLLTLNDGTKIQETVAILVTIGKIGNMNGHNVQDFGISYMLACKAAEVFTNCTNCNPTFITINDYNQEKFKKLGEFKSGELKDFINALDNMCDPKGNFTSQGDTVGEVHLYSVFWQLRGAKVLPDTLPANLQAFMNRLDSHSVVKEFLAGKSKFGTMDDYLLPAPNYA